MNEKLSTKMKLDVCNVRLKKAHDVLWFAITICVEAGHVGDNAYEGSECVSCELIRRAKQALNINQ